MAAVELYTGVPLFPGQNELDLLNLIEERIGKIPQSMIEKSKRELSTFSTNLGNQVKNTINDINELNDINQIPFPKKSLYDVIKHVQEDNDVNQLQIFSQEIQNLLQIEPSKRF